MTNYVLHWWYKWFWNLIFYVLDNFIAIIFKIYKIVLYSIICMSYNNTSSTNILLHILMGNTIRISRMSSRSKTCFTLNYVIEDVIKILNNKSRGRLCNGINTETQIGLRHGTFSCHWTHDKNIYSLIIGFFIFTVSLKFYQQL